ncbi:unnamed protein product, partial [Sphagnum tenellum]
GICPCPSLRDLGGGNLVSSATRPQRVCMTFYLLCPSLLCIIILVIHHFFITK